MALQRTFLGAVRALALATPAFIAACAGKGHTPIGTNGGDASIQMPTSSSSDAGAPLDNTPPPPSADGDTADDGAAPPAPTVPGTDAATDAGGPPDGEAGSAAPGTFGAPCTAFFQCESGYCALGAPKPYCSVACTAFDAVLACPKPPSTGRCSPGGFCEKP